jgi:hypothetical protein
MQTFKCLNNNPEPLFPSTWIAVNFILFADTYFWFFILKYVNTFILKAIFYIRYLVTQIKFKYYDLIASQ